MKYEVRLHNKLASYFFTSTREVHEMTSFLDLIGVSYVIYNKR